MSKKVSIGNICVGGGNPIAIQTMCDVKTSEIQEVIKEIEEVFNLGFEEMLEDEHAVILAEWPDPVAKLFPADRLEINFVLQGADTRKLELSSFGRVSDRLLERLCQIAHS